MPDSRKLNALIEARTAARLEAATQLRRRIHRYPEPGFEEHRTAETIAEFLAPLGLEVRTGAGRTGVVAMVRGLAAGGPVLAGSSVAAASAAPDAGSRRVVALRGDMDALSVTEQTGLPFSSERPGFMHACGHDMHSAIVAGATAVLADLASHLPGDVKVLFQPAEESGSRPAPDIDPFKVFKRGAGGAQEMIAAGVLDGPKVDAIVGMHCWPDLPLGTVGVDPRVAMAGNGSLRVRIRGQGGHGATPHQTIDPVPIAASVVLALQTLVSRRNDPANPFVLSVTTIHGGTAPNVIPDKVELQATLRSVKPGYLEREVPQRIEQLVRGIVSGYGAECDIACGAGLPVTVNDPRVVETARRSAAAILGADNVRLLDALSMTSEDFAYYASLVPAVYLKLGVASETSAAPLHNPFFSPDEGALAVGIKIMVRLAFDLCREGIG
ncbi:MAG: M20 family metallopeptidase [Bacillota bacterium]|nr:M20 family metallopeptidase [Bacillota bacterium]